MRYEPALLVRSDYGYRSGVEGDLNFDAHQEILVVKEVDSDWFEGAINDGVEVRKGIFPKNFTSDYGKQAVKAQYPFVAQCPDDISVDAGEELYVIDYINVDWVKVQRKDGSCGQVPRNYLGQFHVLNNGNNQSQLKNTYVTNGFHTRVNEPVKPKYFPPPSLSSGLTAKNVFAAPTSSFGASNMRRATSTFNVATSGFNDETDFAAKPTETSASNLHGNSTTNEGSRLPDNDFGGSLKRSSSNPDISEDQRVLTLKELVETERFYVKDLDLFFEVFPPASSPLWSDMRITYSTIFGNISEVRSVSKKLLTGLERVLRMPKDQQKIGGVFIDLSDALNSSYTPYCTNFERVPSVIEQCCHNPKIQKFFKEGVDEMRLKGSNIFDLGSFLIKPVQRVMKYPLLLEEICKYTPENHFDKPNLTLALIRLQEVVFAINQNKRTKEVVEKYKNSENGVKSRFSKISFHAFMKKSSRFSQAVSRKITSGSYKDDEFDCVTEKFRELHKSLKSLSGSISACNQTLSSHCTVLTSQSLELKNLLLDKSRTQPFEQHHKFVKDIKDLSVEHVLAVENRVLANVENVSSLFQGPFNLINKRDDKLLDFESLTTKFEKMESPSTEVKEALNTAKGNFMALNDQLKNDLPHFNRHVNSIIHELALELLRLRHSFYDKFMAKMTASMNYLPPISGRNDQFREVFVRKHCEVASVMTEQISFLTESFKESTLDPPERVDPKKNSKKTSKNPKRSNSLSQSMEYQTPSAKASVEQKYSPSDLYCCKTDYKVEKPMHVIAKAGDVVGAKKKSSPMGGKDEWLVDNGINTGLIAAAVLIPHQKQNSPTPRARAESVGNRARPMSCIDPAVSTDQGDRSTTLPPAPCSNSLRNFVALPDKSLTPRKISAPPKARTTRQANSELFDHPKTSRQPRPNSEFVGSSNHVPGSSSVQNFSQIDPFEALMRESSPVPRSQTLTHLSPPRNLMEFDPLISPAEETPRIPAPIQANKHAALFQCHVLWAYDAATQKEISLKEGRTVDVLQTSDLSGNSDWWLVHDPATKSEGYFPSNYLQRI